MNDPKHNPLTPDELFRLLDKKTNNGLNDMDEFEQDALEGFAMLENSEKAKALVAEINATISKKASNSEDKGTQKNKIIWFSAAASIVLIVMISIFFLNQSKKDSNKELALNEQTKGEELISTNNNVSGETAPTPAVAVNTAVKEKETNLSILLPRNVRSEKNTSPAQGLVTKQSGLSESTVSFGAQKEAKDEEKSGEINNRNSVDETVGISTVVLADKLEVNKKSQAVKEESELVREYSIAQNAPKSHAEMDETKELNKKEDTDSKNAEQSYKSKTKTNDATVTTEGISAASSVPTSANSVHSEAAFYTGGEPAIKDFVLTYLKSKQNVKPIIGSYKVKATVFTNGTIKVNSIIETTKKNCNCTSEIKEALNTMTKWNSYSYDNKNAPSEIEFTLSF